ncbi:MAG: AAA family ATPase [Aureispira sp.]|nr:AAA family ATPase [Aureispira sp.]
MLIRFNVTNFLSFKDETEFNMLAGSPRSKKEHVYHQKGIDFMRAAALYGANGAGKSNLVKALSFLQDLIKGTESTQYNKHFMPNPKSTKVYQLVEALLEKKHRR